jgi:hypothetical protein
VSISSCTDKKPPLANSSSLCITSYESRSRFKGSLNVSWSELSQPRYHDYMFAEYRG